MADVIFVLVLVGFFAIGGALVMGLDRIVSSGDDAGTPVPSSAAPSSELTQ
jgi:hypothetical protein